MFTQGFVMIAIGPLIGWVRDYTQDFGITFSLLTLSMAACAVSWLVEKAIVNYQNSKRKQSNVDDDDDYEQMELDVIKRKENC